MRGKYIKEEQVFQPKGKEEIIDDMLNIDFVWPITNSIRKVVEKIPIESFTLEELREIVNQSVNIATEYFNDVLLEDFFEDNETGYFEDVDESLDSTFKPKSKEAIIQELRDDGWEEIVLKDGRSVWLMEMDYPGMAGESMTVLSIVDEDGKQWPLNNETLDAFPFEWSDRKELVELMDDSYQTNYNNAIAYVK